MQVLDTWNRTTRQVAHQTTADRGIWKKADFLHNDKGEKTENAERCVYEEIAMIEHYIVNRDLVSLDCAS